MGENKGVHAFPRVLVRKEIQTTSSRIWTRITDSISSDDNRNAMSASRTLEV